MPEENEKTPEQIAELEKKATDAEVAKTVAETERAKLVEEKDAWEKEKKELESQVNPNWKSMRDRDARMQKALEAQGIKVDDEGNVVDGKQISREDVETISMKQARQEFLDVKKDELLGQFDDAEDQKLVEHYYKKLTAGEEVTIKNINTFMKQATRAAFGDDQTKLEKVISSGAGGRPPRRTEKTDEALSDDQASAMGSQFGIPVATDDNMKPKK